VTMMQLRFHTPALADLCNRRAALDKKWGQIVGAEIRKRLCLLAAVPNLELLIRFPGVLRLPMRIDGHGRFPIEIRESHRILAKPDHDPIPYLRTGELACREVEHLIILEVNGYGL
jgi:hypothetical protein